MPAVIRTGITEFIERVSDDVIDEALARSTIDLDGGPRDPRRAGAHERDHGAVADQARSPGGDAVRQRRVAAGSMTTTMWRWRRSAAGRIADALDNMWLTEQHQHHLGDAAAGAAAAEAPDRSPELDVAVRYWPAGVAVDAGGDFYDVFQTSSTSWSVLIGDVCGTGPDAAALTGIARHTVRAAARHGQDHRAVLEWLNEAMRLSDRDRFCTAVYATLEARDGRWWFTGCAAGHPRPVLAEPGSATVAGRAGVVARRVRGDQPADRRSRRSTSVTSWCCTPTGSPTCRRRMAAPKPTWSTWSATVASTGTAGDIAEAIHCWVTDRLPMAQRADDVALVVLRVTGPPAVADSSRDGGEMAEA